MSNDPTMVWLVIIGAGLALLFLGVLIGRARSRHNEERYRQAGMMSPVSYPSAQRRFEPGTPAGYSPQAYAAQPYPPAAPPSQPQSGGTGRAIAAGAVGGVLGGMAGAEISRRLHSDRGETSATRNWDPPEGPAYYPTPAPKQSYGESDSHSGSSWGDSGGSSWGGDSGSSGGSDD